MQRVKAKAIATPIRPPEDGRLGHFEVEVWGAEPYDYVRHYEIQAKSDNVAAQEGLHRFVEEMEQIDQS
jgi:hypothetical protein